MFYLRLALSLTLEGLDETPDDIMEDVNDHGNPHADLKKQQERSRRLRLHVFLTACRDMKTKPKLKVLPGKFLLGIILN